MAAEVPSPSGNGHKEFKLILPTLQPPYEGVFEEVYEDYLSNPDAFRIGLQYRLTADNPELLTFFRDDSVIANPNLAFKWACIYYAMFERSAKKEGLPPLYVSTNVVDAYNKLSLVRVSVALDNRTEEEVLEGIRTDWEKRREKDRTFSPELVKFWQSVEEDIKRMGEEEEEDYDFYMIGDVLPVASVQAVLQNQQGEYSLIGQYEL